MPVYIGQRCLPRVAICGARSKPERDTPGRRVVAQQHRAERREQPDVSPDRLRGEIGTTANDKLLEVIPIRIPSADECKDKNGGSGLIHKDSRGPMKHGELFWIPRGQSRTQGEAGSDRGTSVNKNGRTGSGLIHKESRLRKASPELHRQRSPTPPTVPACQRPDPIKQRIRQ